LYSGYISLVAEVGLNFIRVFRLANFVGNTTKDKNFFVVVAVSYNSHALVADVVDGLTRNAMFHTKPEFLVEQEKMNVV